MSSAVERAIFDLSAAALFDLTGLVAVVTGGATGIGLDIATTLLANNAKAVYVAGIDNERLQAVCEIWNTDRTKGKLVPFLCDVSDKESVQSLVDFVGQRETYVNVVFSNAGIHGTQTIRPTTLNPQSYHSVYAALTSKDFDRTFKINTYGSYFIATLFLPLLCNAQSLERTSNAGRFTPQVVFTTSMNSHSKDTDTGGYSIPYMLSKSATSHMMQLLAHDWAPLGVRVNAIAPGHVSTAMSGDGYDELGRSKKVSILDTKYFKVPLADKHLGASASDIGSLALMLVVNQYITGERILIDGGTMLEHANAW